MPIPTPWDRVRQFSLSLLSFVYPSRRTEKAPDWAHLGIPETSFARVSKHHGYPAYEPKHGMNTPSTNTLRRYWTRAAYTHQGTFWLYLGMHHAEQLHRHGMERTRDCRRARQRTPWAPIAYPRVWRSKAASHGCVLSIQLPLAASLPLPGSTRPGISHGDHMCVLSVTPTVRSGQSAASRTIKELLCSPPHSPPWCPSPRLWRQPRHRTLLWTHRLLKPTIRVLTLKPVNGTSSRGAHLSSGSLDPNNCASELMPKQSSNFRHSLAMAPRCALRNSSSRPAQIRFCRVCALLETHGGRSLQVACSALV